MKRGWVVAVGCVAALASALARAQAETPRVVELVAAGPPDPAFTESLGELLRRVDLSLRLMDATAPADAADLARVTIDLGAAEPTVLILDPHGRTTVARKTFRAASRRVALEEAALFIRFTLDAMADEQRADASADAGPHETVDSATASPDGVDAGPPDVAAPLPAPVAVPTPEQPRDSAAASKAPPRALFDLGVFGTAQAFSPEIPVLGGVGAQASLVLGRGRFRPALALDATFFARGNNNVQGVNVHTGLVSLRLLPSFALIEGRMVSLDAGLGGGMDLVSLDAHTTRAGATAQEQSDAVPVGTAALMGKVALGARADLFFGLTGDVDLSRRRYVVMVDGAPDAVVSPFPIRVSALLGVSVHLAGEP